MLGRGRLGRSWAERTPRLPSLRQFGARGGWWTVAHDQEQLLPRRWTGSWHPEVSRQAFSPTCSD